jgi:hypothetical protein
MLNFPSALQADAHFGHSHNDLLGAENHSKKLVAKFEKFTSGAFSG